MNSKTVIIALALAVFPVAAHATTGPGCLRIVNVAANDSLNVRAEPSAKSRIVISIPANNYGVLALKGECIPKSLSWGQRWCPISYSYEDGTLRGYVKARFVRDQECP
ncbi:SH3 domain-containing protein [Bacillus subtilis]|uniref:SH3 domain-containing protein n=1 Tax=Pseudochrobactrum asaccharolyticum TaxID=354351 RepID=UPI001F2A1349|nr:SH3 domain-containing protein [Pseudochrobactrum asaccharolyticum]MCF7647204.1 SH3 domain-containing protein [Pseudochrobactrum asaccharolyticum]MCF7673480.1 SH3 domain-containing protein [Bacillus subtilis]